MGPHFVLALALIYRCTIGGVTTFSDRPCAPDAPRYEPDDSRVSTYAPPPAAKTPKSAAAPRNPQKRPAKGAKDPVRHAADCERLRNALREVAGRMRAGYGAKEGEQLKVRKAKLERQRRAQKCR